MEELTLGLGERIAIDGVEVTVVAIRPDRVRLGISAPRQVPVHRKEVYLAIRQGLPQRMTPPDPPPTADELKEPR